MTAIVALVQGGKVYMAGDSAGVTTYQKTVRADKKVFQNGPLLIGCAGSFRMRDLLWCSLVPPAHADEDFDLYMRTVFIGSVMECFRKGKWAEMEKEVQRGGSFLVGVEGRLFLIEEDYQVAEMLAGYAAIGNADDVALGALFATQGLEMSPHARLEIALQAAEMHTTDVCRPFHFLESF